MPSGVRLVLAHHGEERLAIPLVAGERLLVRRDLRGGRVRLAAHQRR